MAQCCRGALAGTTDGIVRSERVRLRLPAQGRDRWREDWGGVDGRSRTKRTRRGSAAGRRSSRVAARSSSASLLSRSQLSYASACDPPNPTVFLPARRPSGRPTHPLFRLFSLAIHPQSVPGPNLALPFLSDSLPLPLESPPNDVHSRANCSSPSRPPRPRHFGSPAFFAASNDPSCEGADQAGSDRIARRSCGGERPAYDRAGAGQGHEDEERRRSFPSLEPDLAAFRSSKPRNELLKWLHRHLRRG